MELSVIIPHIEALIFASDRALGALELTELINNSQGFIEDRATLEQVEASIETIREKYNAEFYPFEVRMIGGGWQFVTKKEYFKTVAVLNGEKFLKRLSNASLETLSIIAYKQPITKGEMEAIRGVNCDYAVQKLLEKELIVISGRNEKLPGHPLVYATSRTFMDYFGINSVEDLPKLKEIIPDEIILPTQVNENFEVSEELQAEEPLPVTDVKEEEKPLVVNENGDLIETEENKESEETQASPEEEEQSDDEQTSDDQPNDEQQ
ncbi:MAG: SMC-Scp complex subunit ScpB [Sphingobacteriales bacterium]|nr:SMC-Scp complex subunit ScpB [Sphingobacteriales bacterium]